MVCGLEKNPIIKLHIEGFTFYLCRKHAIMLQEALTDQLKGIIQLERLRTWARREGLHDE
jgi:hypothetical protein